MPGTPPQDLTARPLALPEIVDRAIALTRRHFGALFVAMLLVQVPAVLLSRRLLELLAAAGAAGLSPGGAASDRALRLLADAARPLGAISLALMVLQLAATVAAAVLVAPTLDPRRGAARPGRARIAWAVISAAALQIALVTAAPVLGAVPGVVLAARAGSVGTALAGGLGALVGGLGLFVVVMLRLIMVPTVAALEGRAGLGALARSSRLMTPGPGARFGDRPGVRASLVLLAMLVLGVAVSSLAGLPRLVALRVLHGAAGLGGPLGTMAAHLPAALEIPLTLVEAAAGAAVQPFSLVAVVVFYFDRRARAEGLDLERWAARLGDAR